jgi:hypothetical protein
MSSTSHPDTFWLLQQESSQILILYREDTSGQLKFAWHHGILP